jgi:predicted RNase H-like nuclease (RuvC/YqgF family)
METTTSAYHPPTSDGVETMGVNPKCPNEMEDSNPIRVMETARRSMDEWNATILPKLQPQIQHLLQQVHTLKDKLHMKQETPEHAKETCATLKQIMVETIVHEQQIQKLYTRLHDCKQQVQQAMEVNPLCTKYLSGISRLPIFGKAGRTKTTHQMELEHYYQYLFLPQYETAMIEYNTINDQCQHILLSISNARAEQKSE